MRAIIKEFVEICVATLPFNTPVYEFGSYQVAGQEGFADLRAFFPGQPYVGADMRRGPGVDVVLDLHNIGLPDASVGSVLILDTLEHVERPWRAMEEVYRILAPGGVVLISSVMNFPIHNHPSDYWRFTPEALRSLLRSFEFATVTWAGIEDFPETIVGVGYKGQLSGERERALRERLAAWQQCWTPRVPPRYERLAKFITPPLMLAIYRTIRDRNPSWFHRVWHQLGWE